MRKETRAAYRTAFEKFIISTKWQLAMLFFGMAAFLVVVYKLAPATALGYMKDVTIGYFGARVLEPIAGEIAGKINGKGRKVTEDEGD